MKDFRGKEASLESSKGFYMGHKVSPSKIQACKHAKFEPLISRAAIASAKRSNILSSKHRGLERSAAQAVASKVHRNGFPFF